MADMWKGTILEPHTVMLLSMLLQEDGTLTAERRHDCKNGICFAIGFQGHHICHRGTPLIYREMLLQYTSIAKKYCKWEDRDGDGRYETSPQQAFEADYPDFAKNWQVQFQEYTLRMTQCIESGETVNQCIQSWNPREVGRITKVKRHVTYVSSSLL